MPEFVNVYECLAQQCAEGVETQGQYELLRGMGVDLIQGYLFSRPVDIDVIKAHRERFLQ